MENKIASALLLAALIVTPQFAAAEVFMCTDPVSGKKTFTDKACPTTGERKKVRVEPTNFGQGSKSNYNQGTWTSDRDTSQAGRANFSDHSRRVDSARNLATTD